jgi:hypothetical protein
MTTATGPLPEGPQAQRHGIRPRVAARDDSPGVARMVLARDRDPKR